MFPFINTFAASKCKSYGLALWRGEDSSSDCSTCVADAATQIKHTCPSQKEAIVWFNNCLLRYSNTNFNGVPSYMWNMEVMTDPKPFNKKVVALFKTVLAKAYGLTSLFGTIETNVGSLGKLYTREQSYHQKVVNRYPSCCDWKKGGRVLDGSCNFRFEIYLFYGVV